MPCILNIDTATDVCSVAISREGNILFEKENSDGFSHSTLLGVFVAEALSSLKSEGLLLDAVAISRGPGSYTGLRIGVSEAKGICYGLGIPLIAIDTPLIMANRAIRTEKIPSEALLCPMIDARRMEVYAAIYDTALNEVRPIAADIVNEATYSHFLASNQVYFFGNGADKCKLILENNPNAIFLDNQYLSAKYMFNLADNLYSCQQFVDVAYFEPFYLKDFVATTPKKNILS